jgi:hypothetical protein
MFLDSVIELQMSHYRFGDKRLQERCFFFHRNDLWKEIAREVSLKFLKTNMN